VDSPDSGEDAVGARHQPAFRTAEPCPAPRGRRCARLPEVFVGGEGLPVARPILLATLLHEAAHALAHIRRIKKDTSWQGHRHNAGFTSLAEEVRIRSWPRRHRGRA
jgi:hypothetical protein